MKILNLSSSFSTWVHLPITRLEEDFKVEHFTYFFLGKVNYFLRKEHKNHWSKNRLSVLIDSDKYEILRHWRFPRTLLIDLFYPIMYNDVYKRIKDKHFDIIHANMIDVSGVIAYKLHKKLNIPYLITEHGSYHHFFFASESRQKKIARKYKKIVENAEAVIAVSEGFRDVLKKLWPKANIVSINNTYDKNIFYPNPKQRDNKGIINLITVGMFIAEKNHFLLLEVMKQLTQKYRNIKLTIIGSGGLHKKYLKFISDNQLSDFVEIKGFMPHHQLIKEYQNSDIFILPSIVESFGIVCLEAMACGLPVIASNTWGPPSIIENNVDGFIFENNSIDDLVSKIQYLLDNPEKIEILGENAIKKAKLYENKHYELYDLYKKIINKKSK
jgi:glycosyltransferase involved in cell wall biosynthesis